MKSSVDRVLVGIAGASILVALLVIVLAGIATGRFRGWFGGREGTFRVPSTLRSLSVGDLDNAPLRAATETGDWEEALRILEPLSAASPSDREIREALGSALYNAAVHSINTASPGPSVLELAGFRTIRSGELLHDEPGHAVNVARTLASIGLIQYEAGDRDKGRAHINDAKARAGEDPYVCYVLGAIMVREGYLAKAQPLLITGSAASEPEIRAASVEILNRIKGDVAAESTFTVAENSSFLIRYEGSPRPEIASRLISILESVQPEVASFVGRAPGRKVEVIVYTSSEFAAARGLPDWVGGIFDGRMRLGYGDAAAGDARLREILAHEYAHAAVFDLLGHPAPTWLDEGIAQVLEKRSDPTPDFVNARINAGGWVSVSHLTGSFINMDSAHAESAYAISRAAVALIVRRNGPGVIAGILSSLKSGSDMDGALRSVIGLDCAGLDAELKVWLGR